MKTFLSKSGILVVPQEKMAYFQSNDGYFLRFADPKEVEFLSGNCPRIQFEVEPEALENPQDLLWRYVATLPEEETEVFARKWGRSLKFIVVDLDQAGRNDREVAHLKLYGVEGDYKVSVWTGPSRFNDYIDDDCIAVEEVSRPLEGNITLDWFAQFGPEAQLEASKNLTKILVRPVAPDEVLSRPMKHRRK